MENLIKKIADTADINEEKAGKALLAISSHVKEQFPLLHSIVDLVLATKGCALTERNIVSEFAKRQFIFN